MAFCEHCGAKLEEGEVFCGCCGTKVVKTYPSPPVGQDATQSTYSQEQCMAEAGGKGKLEEYSDWEVQSGKLMGVLSYCSIFVLIPLLVKKDNRFVRFHVNQGLILFAGEAFLIFIEKIKPVSADSFIVFVILFWLLRIHIIMWTGILSLNGIVNVLQGKAERVPVFGGIKILK